MESAAASSVGCVVEVGVVGASGIVGAAAWVMFVCSCVPDVLLAMFVVGVSCCVAQPVMMSSAMSRMRKTCLFMVCASLFLSDAVVFKDCYPRRKLFKWSGGSPSL